MPIISIVVPVYNVEKIFGALCREHKESVIK